MRQCTTEDVSDVESRPRNLPPRNPKHRLEQSNGEGDLDGEPKPSGHKRTNVRKSKKRAHIHDHSHDNLDFEQPKEDAEAELGQLS